MDIAHAVLCLIRPRTIPQNHQLPYGKANYSYTQTLHAMTPLIHDSVEIKISYNAVAFNLYIQDHRLHGLIQLLVSILPSWNIITSLRIIIWGIFPLLERIYAVSYIFTDRTYPLRLHYFIHPCSWNKLMIIYLYNSGIYVLYLLAGSARVC